MTLLIIAEHDNQQLHSATAAVLTAAKQLDTEIHVLVAGHEVEGVASQAASLSGVSKVHSAAHPAYQHGLAENIAALIVELATGYDYVLAPATTFGKNIMPRVAALLDIQQISDISHIESKDTFISSSSRAVTFALQ